MHAAPHDRPAAMRPATASTGESASEKSALLPGALVARINAALAEGRRRTDVVEEKTAAAFNNLIGWVDRKDAALAQQVDRVAHTHERTTEAVREALTLLVRRLDGLEQAAHRPDPVDITRLRMAHAALEGRLGALERQAGTPALPPAIAAMLDDFNRRLDALADRMDTDRGVDPLPAIGERLDAILDRLPEPGQAEAEGHSTRTALDEVQAQLAALSQKLDQPRAVPGMAALNGAVADVVLAIRETGREDAARRATLDEVQAKLTELSDKLDEPRAVPGVAELNDAVADVMATLRENGREDAARRATLDDVHATLAQLSEKLDEPRPVPGLAELNGVVADVVVAIRENAPGAKLDAIAHALACQQPEFNVLGGKLDAIGAKLDGMAEELNGGREDGAQVAGLVREAMSEQLAALQSILASSEKETLRRTDLEGLVDQLATRIEQAQRQDGEITRRMIAELEAARMHEPAPAEGGETPPREPSRLVLQHDPEFEQRFATLTRRVEELFAPGGLGDIGERLDAVQGLVGDLLRNTSDLTRIEEMIRDLGQKMQEAPRPEPADRMGAAMTLAEKIAASAAAAQTARAIGGDLPRPAPTPRVTPGDRGLAFGMARSIPPRPTERAGEDGPAMPDLIAAARKASQAAQETARGDGTAPTPPQGGGLRWPTRLLGAAMGAMLLGSASYLAWQEYGVPLLNGDPTERVAATGTPADPESVGSLGPAAQGSASVEDPSRPPGLNEVVSRLLPGGLVRAGRSGQAEAAYEIGKRLAEGEGVPRDQKAALKWFEFAAQQGLAPAQYRLAAALEKGAGTAVDLPLARSWYQRAAEKGHVRAMHNLGVLLADGVGGQPDYAAAVTWFRRAAERGLRDSQFNLGILTARGLGVSANLTEAWIWFSLAAAQGDTEAASRRDEVGGRLDAAALARAKAGVAQFTAAPVDARANEVAGPAGGWDELATGGKPKTPGS